MSLMGKCCCGCYTVCECLPSTITLRIPAYTLNANYNGISPYTVSYPGQDVVLYKCCFLNFGDQQSTFLYRSNKIASGTIDVYSFPPLTLVYSQNLYSFFTVSSTNTPNNYNRCCWRFSAIIGAMLPTDYITHEECGTYNNMSNACPTTAGERQGLQVNFDSFYYNGRVYFWTQTPAPYGCGTANVTTQYYLSRCVGEDNEAPVSNCVIGPSPYTLLGDGASIPDIVGIEIL